MKNIIFALLLLPSLLFGQTGKDISNKPSGGTIIGDSLKVGVLNLKQSTASQTITLGNYTSGPVTVYIRNKGSVDVTLSPGGTLPTGKMATMGWTGLAWSTSIITPTPVDTSLLVHKTGGTMTGDLNFNNGKSILWNNGDQAISGNSGTLELVGDIIELNSGNINVSGLLTIQQNIDLQGNNIVNVGTPVDPDDAATKDYVDDAITADSISLASGKILIGQSYGGAAAKTPSGDITITNAGITAIGASKVTNSMLAGSIDLTSKVTGLLPDGNISSASTWNAKQAALVSGTNIKKVKNYSLLGSGNLNTDSLPIVGTIINETWANLSSWTKVGSQTFTVSGGNLSVVGGTPATATFANYYYNSAYGNTNYMHWTITDTITVGTINSTSHGVSVGIESTNSFFKTSLYCQIGLNSTNKGRLYILGADLAGTVTIIDSTSSTMAVAAGNVIIFTVTREYDEVRATAKNTSSSVYNNSISILSSQKDRSTNFRPNVGRFAIFANGGTHTMSDLNIKVKQVVGADLLWIGDSRVIGSGSNESNSFVGLFKEELNGIVDNYCGAGDRNQDYVAAEVLTLAPKNIIILSSTNNQGDGNSAASTANKMHTFTSSLTGYALGANLFYCDELPRGSADMSTYSKALKDTLGQTGCIYTYASAMDVSGTTPNPAWFNSDLLHPGNFGYKELSGIIINQLPATILKANKPRPSQSKLFYQNGKVLIGNTHFVPNHMLEVVDITGLSQIRFGNSSTRNGGFLFSNASNQANIQGGYYHNGTSQIAAETSGSGIHMTGGATAFTTFSGATIGSTVSPQTRALIDNSGFLSLTPATLTDGNSGLSYTATMPTTITAANNAMNYTVTSAGSSSFTNRAALLTYAAGYTGSSATIGLQVFNSTSGTGNALFSGLNNTGIVGSANGTTTGYNIANRGTASNGNLNIGTVGFSITAKNSATNGGGAFFGNNTGTSPIHFGVYAGLNTTDPTFVSAALIADNASATSPIALFRDGGAVTFSHIDGGLTFFGGSTTPTSTLHNGGSFANTYIAKTGTYTATISDYLINCTANSFTVTLPTAVGITGRIYEIVNSGAGTITVGTTSSQTFTNVTATPTTLTILTAAGKSVRIMSDGANWIQLN